eukprot:12027889-Prorocentrum_lima.AAC.1
MISVTAGERALRALRSKSRRAMQLDSCEVGDVVALYKAPANNDITGWRGPATVVHMDEYGTVHMKHQ